MNLLKQKKSFEFFPALNLELLLDKTSSQVSLMSCNMQVPSLRFNSNTLNLKKNVNKKSANKIIQDTVSITSDLYFYTGLKDYYKVNIKKEILAEYFVEKKKNLLLLDKQNKRRSSYISGDSIFPIKQSYEFSKRRFILNLHTRERLNRNEIFLDSFIDIVNDLNASLVASLVFTLYKSRELSSCRLRFFKAMPSNNKGALYHFLGIPRLYLRHRKYGRKRDKKRYPLNYGKAELHGITIQRTQLFYLLKYLPNRHYFLLQYLLTNLHNKKITTILDNNNQGFLRLLIKEFMAIKMFLRFYLVKMKFGLRQSSLKLKRKSIGIFKSMLILFNAARQTYKNIFEYIFNLCALQIVYLNSADDKIRSSYTYHTINALQLAHIYSANVNRFKVMIFPLGLNRGGKKNLTFRHFNKGLLRKKRAAKIKGRAHLKRKHLRFYHRNIMNTRYRSSLFHRRYNLLVKHNPIYFLNKIVNNKK